MPTAGRFAWKAVRQVNILRACTFGMPKLQQTVVPTNGRCSICSKSTAKSLLPVAVRPGGGIPPTGPISSRLSLPPTRPPCQVLGPRVLRSGPRRGPISVPGRCRSSVVEHSLGKGEVVGSIPTGSTILTKGLGLFSANVVETISPRYGCYLLIPFHGAVEQSGYGLCHGTARGMPYRSTGC
jgi:hypothetical protein